MGRSRSAEDHIPPRPPFPRPYDTPDHVSPAFRRIGGYAWRLAAIGVVLWGLLLLITPLQTLILALFFALLVAAWLMPLVNVLAKSMPRWLATVISLVAFAAAVAVIVTFIGLQTMSQWEGISAAFNQGVSDLQTWLREGPLQITDAQLTSVYVQVEDFIRSSGGDIALGVLSGVGSVLGVGTALAAGVFILIFVLIQPSEIFGWFVRWMPARNREVIGQTVRIAWRGFSQYSQGLVLVAITNATLVTIVLLIMGVPLAIPLGIIVFFGAFIPYIGAPIAMLLAAFVALVTDGPLAGALVIVLIFVIGQLEGNVLQPLIMGQTVNLHPVAIVLVTATGAAYFGLLGALIGVPLAAGVYGAMRYLTGPVRTDDGSAPEPAPAGEGTF